MSDLANTEQRPAMRAARAASRASVPNSSMLSFSRSACWSRKAPVPAAQSSLNAWSWRKGVPSGARPTTMYFESWPPISMMLRASGCCVQAAVACATISLTVASPAGPAISSLPEPVTTTPVATASPSAATIARSTASVACQGRPPVRA